MFKQLTLENELIKLIPLSIEHLNEIHLAGNHPDVVRWMPLNHFKNITTTSHWLKAALKEVATGQQLAFATIDKKTNRLVGSTRYLRPNKKDMALEIGHTFITPEFQRSYINTNAKLLLLEHAFEKLNLTRVEFSAHESNHKSRTAILRIGAKFEGILRKHRSLPDGKYRNTALFSILDQEWPGVKSQLLAKCIKYKENRNVPA